MILSYVDVSTGKELDRITITRRQITYTTGVAEDMVQGKIGRYGRGGAIDILRSWSNGYVSTSVILD